MSNLFKKGFASLAIASAMASGVFAGNAAYIDVKVGYINTSKTDSKDESVTAFEMHIKKDKIVVNFDKSANHANSANIKLTVKKTVAGDGIKGANILFKELKASGKNLMPNIVDEKIGKLTFAINQTDKANVLIISAASKKDLIAAMPIKVALSRIDKKMHLAVTRDKRSFNDTVHLYTNNINWGQWNKKKEKVILGNFKKQNDIKPQVNLYSDATESTTDENMTNAKLLIMDGDGKGSMFKSNLLTVVNNVIPNAATTNIGQRKIILEPYSKQLAFNFSTTTTGEDRRISLTPYENLAFNFSGTTADQKSKIILEPYSKQLAFNLGTTTASDPQDAKITFEPYNKHLAFNLGTTITSDPKDAKILFNPHKLSALGKIPLESAIVTYNMAA